MGQGWIKLHRKIQDCWIWNNDKPFDERSAWIDLLLSANHADKTITFNGEQITIKRGQILTSVRKLAARWHWSVNRTYRFLYRTESDGMLQKSSNKDRTLLTLVNYGVYQFSETPTDTPTETVTDTPAEHKQEDKKERIKDINMSSKIEEVVSYLNDKAGKHYKSTTQGTKSCINARLKEGFSVEDLKRVIDVKCNQWLNDPKMNSYLRPETLFAAKHFESYLNEAPAPKPIPIEPVEDETPEMTDEEFFAMVDNNFGEVG